MKPYFFSFSNFLKSPDPAWADMNGFKNKKKQNTKFLFKKFSN